MHAARYSAQNGKRCSSTMPNFDQLRPRLHRVFEFLALLAKRLSLRSPTVAPRCCVGGRRSWSVSCSCACTPIRMKRVFPRAPRNYVGVVVRERFLLHPAREIGVWVGYKSDACKDSVLSTQYSIPTGHLHQRAVNATPFAIFLHPGCTVCAVDVHGCASW